MSRNFQAPAPTGVAGPQALPAGKGSPMPMSGPKAMLPAPLAGPAAPAMRPGVGFVRPGMARR